MDTTRSIQIGVAWADIVINTIWHYLPYIVISLLIGIIAGKKYYEYSNRKR